MFATAYDFVLMSPERRRDLAGGEDPAWPAALEPAPAPTKVRADDSSFLDLRHCHDCERAGERWLLSVVGLFGPLAAAVLNAMRLA